MKYFPRSLGGNVKLELDLSNYMTGDRFKKRSKY